MEELLKIGDEIIEEITRDAVAMFQQAIEREGVVLTEELKNSFNHTIGRTAETVYGEIEFRMYGRFKDMRELKYAVHMPPVEAMEFFIEKAGGVEKFAWVPGYDSKAGVPTQTAINRIAWAIAKHYSSVPSMKRGYRGTWYNESVMKMVNEAKKQLRWRASEWLASHVVRAIEG